VLESAARVLDDLQRAEEDVRRISGETDGTVRVCTQCNTGYHWLPPVLTAFHRKYPKVNISVLPDATTHPIEELLSGRLDLAILTDDVDDPRLRLRPLFSDEMVAIVAPSHPWAKNAWVSPTDLASAHLLLYSSTPETSFTLNKVLAPHGLVPARVSFIMLTEAMIEMARAGLGVGVLPRWSAQAAIAARRIVPLSITRKGVRRRWIAATLKAQPDPQYMIEFIELLAERALPARRPSRLRDLSA
jgi:LysR family transcriptional regulator, regulator for metE and metH